MEEQRSYVGSLEASLKKRQGVEERLHLMQCEFQTTVTQLKTQSAHL